MVNADILFSPATDFISDFQRVFTQEWKIFTAFDVVHQRLGFEDHLEILRAQNRLLGDAIDFKCLMK